ncbi:hypothetical protein HXX76_010167 [Chlamydomonas incerta]|uniref:Uncharacterized protein n=1 Tax=Chlamydomonas incerta TaxID=51695 RepID=A0A835SRJ6_CHLIN|nr:hypothetical protein HXX76_010167 [Chlamydomonas incerta]|eukprot:KAG2430067.1 hypothetical protein HXX76_010167 [Chlamydomonas incerta]
MRAAPVVFVGLVSQVLRVCPHTTRHLAVHIWTRVEGKLREQALQQQAVASAAASKAAPTLEARAASGSLQNRAQTETRAGAATVSEGANATDTGGLGSVRAKAAQWAVEVEPVEEAPIILGDGNGASLTASQPLRRDRSGGNSDLALAPRQPPQPQPRQPQPTPQPTPQQQRHQHGVPLVPARVYAVAAVWVAAKLLEPRDTLPSTAALAVIARSSPVVLAAAEVHILQWCDWAPMAGFVPTA